MITKLIKNFHKFEDHHQVIIALVLGIAVVIFWRGIWNLVDMYLIPKWPVLSAIVSIISGLIILVLTNHLAIAFFAP